MIFRAVERWRFRALLALLLGVMVAQPILSPLPFGDSIMIAVTAMLFAAAFLEVRTEGSHRAPGVAVIAIWATLSLMSRWMPAAGFEFPAAIAALALTVMLGWATFGALFHERRADLDSLAGAIFGYFLLALLFGQVFHALEVVDPGSFSVPDDAPTFGALQYFSLVTITTLGYGDVLPVAPLARILAGIEAAFGTLYIAILIGRIVGAIGPKKHEVKNGEPKAPGR